MHVAKSLLIVCMAALGANSLIAQTAADSDLQSKAREQLRQKMAELDAQQPRSSANSAPAAKPVEPVPQPAPAGVVTPPEPVKPSAPPIVAPPTTVIVPSKPAPVVVPPGGLSPEAAAKVREALHQTTAEMDERQKAAAAEVAHEKAVKHPAGEQVSPKTPPAASMPMPAALAPGSKEQRLAELLQLYKADKITPVEYHEQRAKILAEH
jgi:hypothetical protein